MTRPNTMVVVVAAALVLAVSSATVSATSCDITGAWDSFNSNYLRGHAFHGVDTPSAGSGTFNMTLDIRHGAGVVPGIAYPNGTVDFFYNNQTINATFTPDCNGLVFGTQVWGDQWCRLWTPNCTAVDPPFGQVFSVNNNFMSNMVLQREPSMAAVYGIAPGMQSPDVNVTVIDVTTGKSYFPKVSINTTQQAFGGAWTYPWTFRLGPFTTWKALLDPMPAGGNYTISAHCSNCQQWDVKYQTSTIYNVTFGDMWYCSGQSNAWLPLLSTFSRNDTKDAIVNGGKYRNIRLQVGNSGAQDPSGWNPWMTALTAATVKSNTADPALFDFSGMCWYFAQKLTDEMEAAGQVVPIGLQDTAVGGQRIEEYMDNATIAECTDRAGENLPQWDGPLFEKFVFPYVDMTVKGWVWYQGENNMGATKGNYIANVGYGCEMANLVKSWRAHWSRVPGTTPADAPFGIVTLASSGGEGNPWMGAMRWAQTSNFGVLPNPAIPNSFVTQAYDLDDPWGPAEGPCFSDWECCGRTVNATKCNAGTNNNPAMCDKACAAYQDTVSHGGIHPRDKKPVGDRMGLSAWVTAYGGKGPATGPTLAGCTVTGDKLEVRFNTTLLAGDEVIVQQYNQTLNMSYLEVQTDASLFCVEVVKVNNTNTCPSWAGGSSVTNTSMLGGPDVGWMPVNMSLTSTSAVTGDLSSLMGAAPTAVRYAWGTSECCDKTDPKLYVDYPCGPAACPIMMKTAPFPANPFIAKIVDGKCECVAPQTCDG